LSVVYCVFENHIIGVMVSMLTLSVVHCVFENHIIGVMVSMLTLSVVYCVFEHQLGQAKDYKLIFATSTKHVVGVRAARWLFQNQDNVS
jgi:uncharacterized metal-binding protein